ncbi:hypothetical protein [Streptomyces atratus]|uniref:Uncharacterized protein n=1 Tax=Streptomyces atratus TaxID=1893 RepID=A0A1K2CQ58_STRAR|nr:hypothetical protein [Streptomyces atratus]SFY13019.1 hypothetical protein SAMN02787144_1011153 [Streptomyces atratus]
MSHTVRAARDIRSLRTNVRTAVRAAVVLREAKGEGMLAAGGCVAVSPVAG